MYNLLNRQITLAAFHTTVFLGGAFGDVGDKLPSSSKTFETEMIHTEQGVYLRLSKKGARAEALIPWGNVKIALYANNTDNKASVQAA